MSVRLNSLVIYVQPSLRAQSYYSMALLRIMLGDLQPSLDMEIITWICYSLILEIIGLGIMAMDKDVVFISAVVYITISLMCSSVINKV